MVEAIIEENDPGVRPLNFLTGLLFGAVVGTTKHQIPKESLMGMLTSFESLPYFSASTACDYGIWYFGGDKNASKKEVKRNAALCAANFSAGYLTAYAVSRLLNP